MTTKRQFTGSNARLAYKPEKESGVLAAVKSTTAIGVTAAAVNPGGNEVALAAATTIVKGDTILLGDGDNQEILSVSAVDVAKKLLTLDSGSVANFRHETGETVTKLDSIGGWYDLGGVTSFTPRGERAVAESAAFGTGVRAVANTVLGRYEFGGDLTVEVDITVMPLWFLHSLNAHYISTGTEPSSEVETKVSARIPAGVTEFNVASETGLAVNDFIEIGGQEVVKISNLTGKKVKFAGSHPHGLRYAHAKDAAVKKVEAPFTHTIIKGLTLPAGLTLLLHLSEGDDQHSLALLTGCRINSLSLSVSGTETISTATVSVNCARLQVLSKNIFGAAQKIPHKLYAQWEVAVAAGDADNRLNSLSLDIENNISSPTPLGSALPGVPSVGQGRVSGSFEYEYRSQSFAIATAVGLSKSLNFLWSYIADPDYSLQVIIPSAKFGGAGHPPVPGRDPITDTKTFTAEFSSSENTDIKIVAKTKNPTIEYLTEI